MDARRIGRVLRAVREHLGLTQREVGEAAALSQAVVSRAERGDVSGLRLSTLDRLADALGAVVHVDIRYRGGEADRLVDRAHASIVEFVVGVLRGLDWEVVLEYSFNEFGERGSVDVLAWHARTRTLLIVEVKSRFTDLQAMLLSLGRKLRLVPGIVREELGWDVAAVGRIIVVSGTAHNRSVAAVHRSIFDASFPARAADLRRWLRGPSGPIAGIWFVSTSTVPTPRQVGRRRREMRDRRSGRRGRGAGPGPASGSAGARSF
jgi:transcriptional regulator with XRE-family HTH domain